MIGQTLGHYRIVREIGAGGMGVVYQAEDTTLGRQVALKILPPELADDDDRRLRFAREARAVAALNHPNIVTVHSVEESGGIHFITMELVKGKTLAELLPRQGFALGRFFEITIPLVDAVSAAHQQGIAHRDLKPANVMIGDDGRIKVLDFGLAKGLDGEPGRVGDGPTQSATRAGHTVGTPAYMSPEQAQGERVDTRSDIFSLGIVFYEMLTGRRPFNGGNPASVISAILRDRPRPVTELQPTVPRALARLVDRCLAEEPPRSIPVGDRPSTQPRGSEAGRRFGRRVRGFRTSADDAAFAHEARCNCRGRRRARSRSRWLLASHRSRRARRVRRAAVAKPGSSDLGARCRELPHLVARRPASGLPGERSRVFPINSHDIWVAQLGGGEPVNLTRDSPANDRRPSWSPSGRDIAFFSDRDGEWGVFVVAAIGGSPRKVLALPGFNEDSWSAPQWARDGSRLFVAANEGSRNIIIELALATLEVTRIALPEHVSPRRWDISMRPDGGRFAYLEASGGGPEVSRLWTVDASGSQATPLTDGMTSVWNPSWSNDGRQVYYISNRGGGRDLWQQDVAEDGTPTGDPMAVTTGLGMRSAAFSPDGSKLAYSLRGTVSTVWRLPILPDRPATWSDATRVTSERAFIEFVDVSPDGQQLAVSSDRRGNQDLWVLPATGGEMTPLTTDPTPDWSPRWSPDGSQIAFYAYRSGNRDIWVMPARGGPARPLTNHPAIDWFPSWSPPDGREIAFDSQREGETAHLDRRRDGRGTTPRDNGAASRLVTR